MSEIKQTENNKAASASAPTNASENSLLKADAIWILGFLILTFLVMLALNASDLAISLSFKSSWGGAFGEFIQNRGRKPATPLILGAGAALAFPSIREKYALLSRAGAALAAQTLIHPAILTNFIKFVWGRPRPVHLGASGEGFVNFYSISPGFGDFSFPSGHVAVAMILSPCALLLWRQNKRAASVLIWAATIVWAGTVAYGRVAYGAHFPTDAAFSIGLGVALAPVSVRLGDWALNKFGGKNKVKNNSAL